MKTLRVLVVEDDTVIGSLLADMLRLMGYDVCAVEATEAEAVTAAARCRPDLMIVDALLGEGSGLSAVEQIRRTGPVPHLFLCSDVAKVRAQRPNAVVLQKPASEADLARGIRRALDAPATA